MAKVITVDDLGDVIVHENTDELILDNVPLQDLFMPCSGCGRIVHHTDGDGFCDECKKDA